MREVAAAERSSGWNTKDTKDAKLHEGGAARFARGLEGAPCAPVSSRRSGRVIAYELCAPACQESRSPLRGYGIHTTRTDGVGMRGSSPLVGEGGPSQRGRMRGFAPLSAAPGEGLSGGFWETPHPTLLRRATFSHKGSRDPKPASSEICESSSVHGREDSIRRVCSLNLMGPGVRNGDTQEDRPCPRVVSSLPRPLRSRAPWRVGCVNPRASPPTGIRRDDSGRGP